MYISDADLEREKTISHIVGYVLGMLVGIAMGIWIAPYF